MNSLKIIALLLCFMSFGISHSQSEKKSTDSNFEDIHLVANISNNNPKINEPVTITYKLYVSQSTGVNSWTIQKPVDYKHFKTEDVEIEIKVENEKFKGEKYRYVLLKKTILTPEKPGEIEIDPLLLDVGLSIPSEERNTSGGRVFKEKIKHLSSNTIIINVKPPLRK